VDKGQAHACERNHSNHEFSAYELSQMTFDLKSFSCACRPECILSSGTDLNAMGLSGHLKGFSPVWLLIWISYWDLPGTLFWQMLHLIFTLKHDDFTARWKRRFFIVENSRKHTLQDSGFSFFSMSQNVSVKKPVWCKGCFTKATEIFRILPVFVQNWMCLQLVFLWERRVARITAVWMLANVNSHMSLQMTSMKALSVAKNTLKLWHFACMRS